MCRLAGGFHVFYAQPADDVIDRRISLWTPARRGDCRVPIPIGCASCFEETSRADSHGWSLSWVSAPPGIGEAGHNGSLGVEVQPCPARPGYLQQVMRVSVFFCSSVGWFGSLTIVESMNHREIYIIWIMVHLFVASAIVIPSFNIYQPLYSLTNHKEWPHCGHSVWLFWFCPCQDYGPMTQTYYSTKEPKPLKGVWTVNDGE